MKILALALPLNNLLAWQSKILKNQAEALKNATKDPKMKDYYMSLFDTAAAQLSLIERLIEETKNLGE